MAYVIKGTCSYNRGRRKLAKKTKAKQNQNRNFSAIFLIQYFCLHGILLFSKSCPEIDQPQSASEEGLLKCDITLLFVQHFV